MVARSWGEGEMSFKSTGIKFQLSQMTRDLLYIVLIVNSTVLHTQKFVVRLALMLNILATN